MKIISERLREALKDSEYNTCPRRALEKLDLMDVDLLAAQIHAEDLLPAAPPLPIGPEDRS